MKFKYYIYILIFKLLAGYSIFASSIQEQNRVKALQYLSSRDEVYFYFKKPAIPLLQTLSGIVSIDKISGDSVFAYANTKEFIEFEKFGIGYVVLIPPSLSILPENRLKNTSLNADTISNWNFYPSYGQYVSLMYNFQASYPSICKVVEIGKTVNNRSILFVRITDNVTEKEEEPEFMYTSTIHGDEVVGYVLMLQLIDTLLTGYNKNDKITELINNIDIWINPLFNPDGTYFVSNSSVSGARRYNANSVDLNRNFPDPRMGEHPDNNPWQPETQAMMLFMEDHNFSLIANFHGGAEVVNFPWDTWNERHPDDAWYYQLSRDYADTVHYYAGGLYMTDLDNGVTNGYDWYPVAGGRQDYANYFRHARETTIEISNIKMPLATSLPEYWKNNLHSFLNYIQACSYGVMGTVKDSVSLLPLKATVEVINHDKKNSHVYTTPANGFYTRFLFPGNYTLRYSVLGYKTKEISGVDVIKNTPKRLDVLLQVDNAEPVNNVDPEISIAPNPFREFFSLRINGKAYNSFSFQLVNIVGQLVYSYQVYCENNLVEKIIYLPSLPEGIYFALLQAAGFNYMVKLIKI